MVLDTAKRYSGYSSVIRTSSGPVVITPLQQLENYSIVPGSRISTTYPAGSLDPTGLVMGLADAAIRFGTRDLATILDTDDFANILHNGVCITGVSELYFQQRNQCGGTQAGAPTFKTGAVHEKFVVTRGWLGIRSINAEQESEDGALAELELVPLWDETIGGEPITQSTADFSGAQSTPTWISQFFLGPTFLEGAPALATLLDGVTGVRINTGITFDAKRASGDTFPRGGAITSRRMQVQITTTDVEHTRTAVGSIFLRAGATIAFFLRKGAEDAAGGRVLDATTEHIKIAVSSAGVTHDDISVQQIEDGLATITIHVKTTPVVTFEAIPVPA